MTIAFNWVVRGTYSLQQAAEKEIEASLKQAILFKACHKDRLLVSILSLDVGAQSLTGNIRCQCDRELATFAGASNGAQLQYNWKAITRPATGRY